MAISYPSNANTGAGTSDTIVVLDDGLAGFVEWKTEQDDVTTGTGRDRFVRQLRFLKRAKAHGACTIVAWSVEEALGKIDLFLARRREQSTNQK